MSMIISVAVATTLTLGSTMPSVPAAVDIPAEADSAIRLKRGTRVRAWVERGERRKVDGWLRSADEATVTVDTDAGEVTLPRSRIIRFEYRPKGRNHPKGAAIGAAVTGAAGLALGVVALAAEKDSSASCGGCAKFLAFYTLVFAVPGAAIGVVFGAPAHDWKRWGRPAWPSSTGDHRAGWGSRFAWGFASRTRSPPRGRVL